VWLITVLWSMLACTSDPTPSRSSDAVDGQPNFVIIDIDSLRSDRILAQRNGAPLAPHLMDLAKNGVLYTTVVTPAAWTLPSVVSLITGRHPQAALMKSDASIGEEAAIAHTLPNILATYGYTIGAAWGGTTLSYHDGLWSWFGGADKALDFATIEGFTERIAKGLPEPFFVMLHDIDLHLVYPPLEQLTEGMTRTQYRAKFEERRLEVLSDYDNRLVYYDARVGRFMAALRASGLSDRTVVIVTSNHGEQLYDHRKPPRPHFHGHGKVLFDTVLTVPLIIEDPASTVNGRVISTPIQTQDIAPTVLARAQIPVHREMTGISLLPSLQPNPEALPDRAMFSMTFDQFASLRETRYKLVLHSPGCALSDMTAHPPLEGVQCEQLYDLQADPLETQDLAPSNPETTSEMRQRLLAWVGGRLKGEGEGEHSPRFMTELRRRGYWNSGAKKQAPLPVDGGLLEGKAGPASRTLGDSAVRSAWDAKRVDSREVYAIKQVPPDVTASDEQAAGQVVICIVRLDVDVLGIPSDVSINKCPEAYSEAVRVALMQWRFRPVEVGGQTSAFWIVKEVRFVPNARP
jgi:choline-sulfatase